MGDDVRREQHASKTKIQQSVKDRVISESSGGERFRNTPAGRRLAALRQKKLDADK